MEEIFKYSELNVLEELKRAMDRLGFEEMTEVQRKAIPVMLTGRDLVVKAPTGTGKTFAFGIPIIQRIDTEGDYPQALILAPTRELAQQIDVELKKLTAFLPDIRSIALFGGVPIQKQILALKKRPQIIVATPGRLGDHMGRHTVKLDKVTMAVCDEADEMLDLGFFKDVSDILSKLPAEKQLAMFSATITREVMDIMWMFQRDAAEITVEATEESRPKITQYSIEVPRLQKTETLLKILKGGGYRHVLIFCNTRRMVDLLCRRLKTSGLSADGLSSDVSQSERNAIMAKFKADTLDMLVATDVAARGIDVNDVEAVFNYDVPQDNAYYLHRIGRTGRAKKEGVSFIFVEPMETVRLRDIIKYTRSDITPIKLDASGNIILQ